MPCSLPLCLLSASRPHGAQCPGHAAAAAGDALSCRAHRPAGPPCSYPLPAAQASLLCCPLPRSLLPHPTSHSCLPAAQATLLLLEMLDVDRPVGALAEGKPITQVPCLPA